MIDSHCHIGIGKQYTAAITDEILKRAHQAGVEKMLTVACSYDDVQDLTRMTERENVFGAFGIHPENASDYQSEKVVNVFKENSMLVALGEIGLDYYYSSDTRTVQLNVFEDQIELASRLNLPIIIHTRDAEADTISILKSAHAAGLLRAGGVLHCFTGTQKLADAALDLGLFISASGIITFNKADELRAVFSNIPLQSLLIETDSPYLAPVPYRGKDNEPAFLPQTANKLAQIKNIMPEELVLNTTKNFNRLFLKGK